MSNPTRELIQRFYDVSSRSYLEIYGEHIHDGYYITGRESRKEAQENLIRYLACRGGIGVGARVLDVGCGIGGGSVWLAGNVGAVTLGINISPVQVDMARELARSRGVSSRFMMMDAQEMSFDGKFDVVWAVDVCTHLQDQRRFIEKATAFLDENGKFIIFDWMINGGADLLVGRRIRALRDGLLLANLHAMNEYLGWFVGLGYRIISAEDVTPFTIRTWDEALSSVRQPGIWKLIRELAGKERKRGLAFVRGLLAMKAAMQKKTVMAGAIVAEKGPENRG